MSTFKNLVSLCIMFGFVPLSTKAQLPYKISYQKKDIVSSLSIDTFKMNYNWLKASSLTYLVDWVPTLTDITKKPGFTFNTTNRNNYDLINSPSLLNKVITKLPWEVTTMEISGITSYSSSKWNSFTELPFIDTPRVYFYPLKRTYVPTFSESCLYRNSALILMGMMQFRYPGAFGHPKYPQAFTLPMSPCTNKSEK